MKCFFLAETDQISVSFRRYKGNSTCSASGMGYCDAEVHIDQRQANEGDKYAATHSDCIPSNDPRWPKQCACGYEFTESDEWQVNERRLYKRSDTGELVGLRDAPVGAMWYASWYSDYPEFHGHDGKALVVRLPNKHDWMVDSRASNCDSPCKKCGKPYNAHHHGLCDASVGYRADRSNSYEDARPHKCWVRHGTPPDIHVDKNGVTCGAGTGSIAIPGYHGFLHNGHLTDC